MRVCQNNASTVDIRYTVCTNPDNRVDEAGQKGWTRAGTTAVTRAVLRPGSLGNLGGLHWVDFCHNCLPDFWARCQSLLHFTPRVGRDENCCIRIERSGKVTPDHVASVLKLHRDLRTVAREDAKPLDLKRVARRRSGRKRLRRPSGEARGKRRVFAGPEEPGRG